MQAFKESTAANTWFAAFCACVSEFANITSRKTVPICGWLNSNLRKVSGLSAIENAVQGKHTQHGKQIRNQAFISIL
jgi:hypothetical protein